jgi:hypothetical protein
MCRREDRRAASRRSHDGRRLRRRRAKDGGEKELVTPANAGVQELKYNAFVYFLDSGLRRND